MSYSAPDALRYRKYQFKTTSIVRHGWLAACLFLVGATAWSAEPTIRSIEAIEQALARTWTRQEYLHAYAAQHELGDWNRRLQAAKGNGSLEHGIIELASPAAGLFRETRDLKYFEAVRDMLLAESRREPSPGVFALPHLCILYDRIKDAPELTAEHRQAIEECLAKYADLGMKRELGGAMNRGLVNLLGLAYVCRLLPRHPHRETWQKTHERAFAEDVLRLQDTNEDSTNYNMLWFMVLIDYVRVSGIDEDKFYAYPNVRSAFERTLAQVSPLGNIPQYGDADWGIGFSPSAFERAAHVYKDGRYRWAAQRGVNFYRMQPGLERRMPRPHYGLISDWTDDSIQPRPSEIRSFYSHQRYGREFPDKLILRSGYGPRDSYLLMNLFDGGGHGTADGSAIVSLIDQYSVLLAGAGHYENDERYQNLVLIRRPEEGFPFIGAQPAFPVDRWRRAVIALREANTSIGGITPDLAQLTQLNLRIEPPVGELLIDDVQLVGAKERRVLADFEANSTDQSKEVTEDAPQGQSVLKLPGALTMPFPLAYPIDASRFDTLEFWWKIRGGPSSEPRSKVHVSLLSGKHINRWHWDFLFTSRRGRVALLKDFQRAHLASVVVTVKDYLGGDHQQNRDIVMLPGGLVVVRDTFRFGTDQECQVGPLWHVQNVHGRGENWFQTSQTRMGEAVRGKPDPNSWINVPGNLLIYFVPQVDMTVNTSANPNPNSPRPNCLFQKWNGQARRGDVRTFTSLLVPNEVGASSQAVVGRVQALRSDQDVLALRIGSDLIVMNPAGGLVEIDRVATDCKVLVVREVNSPSPYAAGIDGTRASWQGRVLHEAGSRTDFER